ncbi:MAG TPA: universal stress protein [Oligoflexus sp.]|uniref:universal stress protein n=1 Tax=Oligoflexus sp. TaxID=1971216 RepID=UPI002D7E7C30|nr:universal stress protein [Oligoflexus sp.]HET9239307.1 universal stress protein [Oligoflexus sp.]
MKKAVIALSPSQDLDENLDHFYETLKLFQNSGFFPETSVVSVIHPALYMMPSTWYRDSRARLAKEALVNLEKRVQQRFKLQNIKVLQAATDSLEYLGSMVSRYAQRCGSDVLIVASNDRTGLPHWILGSFSETVALLARHPTLVIKPHISPKEFAATPHMVVGIDVAVPPTSQDLRWITEAAKTGGAALDLVYVNPKPRLLLNTLQQGKSAKSPQSILESIQNKLQKSGLDVHSSVVDEGDSISQTLVDFAEQKKTWAIITIAVPRSTLRKRLLGSHARRVLRHTRRPFLSLHKG